jgi:rare lipoprotein A
MRLRIGAATSVLFFAYACATTPSKPAEPQPPTIMHGVASWYGQEFAGRTTANGEIFDPLLLTAAHRTLPFGTIVDVKSSKTNQTVRVRINDRGPFVGNRMIDLSYAAAQQIGLVEPGSGEVDVYIVQLGKGDREPPAPYVVTVPNPPKSADTDRQAPAVEFPLPSSTPQPAAAPLPKPAEGTEFSVSVAEEHRGVDTRRQVAADGKAVQSVSVETEKPVPETPAPKAEPRPSAPAPAKHSGAFVVQVGAFSVEANAKSLQEKLTQIGEQAYIDRDTLYKVRIGPFATREQAIKTRERLEANGMSAIVVAN